MGGRESLEQAEHQRPPAFNCRGSFFLQPNQSALGFDNAAVFRVGFKRLCPRNHIMPVEDPEEIPNPIQSGVDGASQQRPRRPRPLKKRTVVQGDLLGDTPRQKTKKRQEQKREAPVIPHHLLERLASAGKWVKHVATIRYAIWHCVRATPQTAGIDDLTLWDRLGRWGAETRSVKTSEEICGRHMGLGQLQRLVIGIRQIEANPVRSRIMQSEANQTLKAVVQAWEVALERYLKEHPEHMQSPDEFAGFVKMSQAEKDTHQGLLDKPAVARKPGSDRAIQPSTE